ncbi:hypothetical protein FQN54_003359 [Arachnomyces sp. PD_36]|nr:hypothetical protein FQN54_003359 [Arachnomyces sp. PD_36]
MACSWAPSSMSWPETFYRRMVLDMMMASQQNSTTARLASPNIKSGIMDSMRDYKLPYSNHHPTSHQLMEHTELRGPSGSATQEVNGKNNDLNRSLSCIASSGVSSWARDCPTRSHKSTIDKDPLIGNGVYAGQSEVGAPYSAPQVQGQSTSPTKQEPTTDDLATDIHPLGMESDSFGGLPRDLCGWPAACSMEIGSGPPVINNTMDSTAALKMMEGCWWGDESLFFGSQAWADETNDGMTDFLMTPRDVSVDSIENGPRFPSPYDSQCSPVSSFASNSFTQDPITLAPQDLECSRINNREFPQDLQGTDSSLAPTTLVFDGTQDGYMQPDKPAKTPSQMDGESRRSQRRTRGKTAPQRCNTKDAFLVRSKRAGMSYKEIKERGHFTEAESTLRGRYRTLTKKKELRVRKPEWKTKDMQLLCEAVEKYTQSIEATRAGYGPRQPEALSDSETRCPRIPWKLVGEYIWKNGGSYHFGNATCKKKWEELQASNGLA